MGQHGVLGEQPHKQRPRHPGQHKKQRGVAHAQAHKALLGLAHPVHLAGAVVEAQNPLGAAADASQRHGDHQHKALHNGVAGDQHVPVGAAGALQNGVHGDDHHVVHRHNEEGREAHHQHPAHHPHIVAPKGDGHLHPLAKEEADDKGRAGRLGNHRGDGRTPHAHVQGEDEHRVQHNVQRRAQHHRGHADFGKALADDKLV